MDKIYTTLILSYLHAKKLSLRYIYVYDDT